MRIAPGEAEIPDMFPSVQSSPKHCTWLGIPFQERPAVDTPSQSQRQTPSISPAPIDRHAAKWQMPNPNRQTASYRSRTSHRPQYPTSSNAAQNTIAPLAPIILHPFKPPFIAVNFPLKKNWGIYWMTLVRYLFQIMKGIERALSNANLQRFAKAHVKWPDTWNSRFWAQRINCVMQKRIGSRWLSPECTIKQIMRISRNIWEFTWNGNIPIFFQ
jgi:hypothetical protein